jgi:transposase
MKGYRRWDPLQAHLFPPSPADWLRGDHLVYFLLDVLEDLDLHEIEVDIHSKDARGTQPYHPRMMVGLLLYGYCVGVVSSRKLERATQQDIAFRVLCAGQQPDHTVISEFRRKYIGPLSGLFAQVLRLCQEAGLVKLGHVALDGTKVQANASKHKAMSHERMRKSEEQLRREVAELLERAERTDREEDDLYGKDRRGDELPEELKRRESRLKKIKEAKARLEAEAARARAERLAERAENARREAEQAEEPDRTRAERKAEKAAQKAAEGTKKAVECSERWLAQAQQHADLATYQARTQAERSRVSGADLELARAVREHEKASRLASGESAGRNRDELPEHRVEADKDGDPAPRSQMNFTDSDSRIMKSGSGFLQGYNCQAAVDEEHQIIVAQALSNQAPDQQHLRPLLGQVVEQCGAVPEVFTADAGYWSEANAEYCEQLGTEAYISTARQKHGEQGSTGPPPPPAPGVEPEDARERMSRKLQTERGRQCYGRRKAVVEAPFGQIKHGRGFRQFLLRGIDKARGEWSLICAGHNLLKLFRARTA